MRIIKKWAKGELILGLVVVGIAFVAGCLDDKPANEAVGGATGLDSSEVGESYSVTGRVRSITPDRDFIMVRHDAIDGLMDAMTMPFAVSDTTLVTGLASGDSIQFVIRVSGADAVISQLEIVSRASPPSE